MPSNLAVWGFPQGYNPNLMGDRCRTCGAGDRWVSQPTALPDTIAWICSACCRWPPPFAAPNASQIPD